MNEQYEKKPLICVPITGKTELEIETQLQKIIEDEPDVIEWRADFFEDLENTAAVQTVITNIAAETAIPLLFTIRSEQEGGEPITLSKEGVVRLLCEVSAHEAITYVDFEIENEDDLVTEVRNACKKHAKKLILSYHHFTETPANELLYQLANRSVALGADIVKMAVMPTNREDVLRLLHITNEMDQQISIPVITMSMGELGQISRIIGWIYGSVMTFAVGVKSSAPGQIEIGKLREAIHATQSIVKW